MTPSLSPSASRLLEACERVMPDRGEVVELRAGQQVPVFSLAVPFDSRAPGRGDE